MIITLSFSNGNNRGIVVENNTTIEEVRNKFLINDEKNLTITYNGKELPNTIKMEDLTSKDVVPILKIQDNKDDKEIPIQLKFLNGETKSIVINSSKNVADMKKDFLHVKESNIDDVKLICSGKIINNDQKINELGLNDNSFIVVLTSNRSILDKLSGQNTQINSDSDTESEKDEINLKTNLFIDDSSDEESEEETDEQLREVIEKNNSKFLELTKDQDFNTLISIILNKPDYIAYALKFVQTGMIFNKPEDNETTSSYQEEFDTIKKLNLAVEEDKIKQALEISKGDIQMSIRYMFQSKYDKKLNSDI